MADTGGASVRLDGHAIDQLLREPGGDVGRFLLKLALKVETAAKREAPVDTGRLRSSITHQLVREGKNLVAYVGTPVKYAIYVEKGRAAGSPPPSSALAGWASRHGMAGNEFVIAQAIGARGIKPRPFLETALKVAHP
jgi:hypothetical protein